MFCAHFAVAAKAHLNGLAHRQATDWLDGYLARRMRLQSVMGSYLDPLGDKMLICSVALALAYKARTVQWIQSPASSLADLSIDII